MSQKQRTRLRDPEASIALVEGEATWGPLSYGPYVTDQSYEKMTDVVTDNYRKRIANGEIINNPCTYEKVTTKHTTGSASAELTPPDSVNTRWDMSGPMCALMLDTLGIDPVEEISLDIDDYAYLHDSAKLQALSNIDKPSFAFGEDVGEIRETLKFLRSPTRSILDLGYSFRRAFRRKIKKERLQGVLERARNLDEQRIKGIKTSISRDQLKSFRELNEAHASVWLSYRFALSPLLRSVSDAWDATVKWDKSVEYPERLTANGYAHSADAETSLSSSGPHHFKCYRNHAVRHHSTILYTISNPVRDWKWRYGLRVQDIPHTLWQLLPYSFVVDRAVDISSSVRGLTNLANPKVTILSGSHTVMDDLVKDTIYLSRDSVSPWTITSFTPSTLTRTEFSYKRIKWRPSVVDVIPPTNIGGLVDDATKIADTIALGIGLFRPLQR